MKNFIAIVLSMLITSFAVAEDGSKQTEADRLNALGEQYHFAHGVKRDYDKAREYYLQAVDLGSASAANHLGRLYINGEGVEKNDQEAEKWYVKSAELNPSIENKCMNNQHPNKILCGLVMAAKDNSAPAQYYLGSLYEMGDPELSVNLNKAFQLYLSAAKQGFSPAFDAVARCYRLGIGTEANAALAQQSIKKAQALKN